jgi:hypothetical protein
MTIPPGTLLGPYEILASIGAGGMGEVYKAKDTRLDRLVAVKVLPEHLAASPDALARFEREAKAVAALNHPNITGIFDLGRWRETTYVAMELLEGESLRARLKGGPIPPRQATELAIQMAQGLAAAHEKGVIHRDLKPDNLWITREGRLKILDFGLAKQTEVAPDPNAGILTQSIAGPQTEVGMIMGTLGYMSPEQVRGTAVDCRADIFSFGAVLFEMLTGKKAFSRETAADTLSAILKEEPPDLDGMSRPIPPGLRRILDHCLEKLPARRFHDAEDLAFALENLANASDGLAPFTAPFAPQNRRTSWQWGALVAVLLLGASLAGMAYQARTAGGPSFRRLTFGKGTVEAARFVPGSREILFSARWNGNPPEIFSLHPDGLEPRGLGLAGASLVAVAATGELAVRVDSRLLSGFQMGSLARVTSGGGKRIILEDAQDADWLPAESGLATIHLGQAGHGAGIVSILEFPAGRLVPETPMIVWGLRVSPWGDRLACFEQPTYSRGDGFLTLVDRQGVRKRLAEIHGFTGLAWGPRGKEIWYSETQGSMSSLWAITTAGRKRLLMRQAGLLELLDVGPDGRALTSLGLVIQGAMAMTAPDFRERELSYNEATYANDISPDGRNLLLTAQGAWGSNLGQGSVFLRPFDGSNPVRLGEGGEAHFMPDGNQVLTLSVNSPTRFNLVPLRPGPTQDCPTPQQDAHEAFPLPDNRRVVVAMNEIISTLDLVDGSCKPLVDASATNFLGASPVSPDGRWVALSEQADKRIFGHLKLYSTQGAPPVPVKGLEPLDLLIRWGADGKSLYVFNRDGLPARIHRIDLATGRRTPVREVMPVNPSGMSGILNFVMTADGQRLAYNYVRKLSDLFLIEGLH